MINSSSATATRFWVIVVVILVVLGVSFLIPDVAALQEDHDHDHRPASRLPTTPSSVSNRPPSITSDPNGVWMLSIGDGVGMEIQPDGRFSVMTERADLRSNLIHISKKNQKSVLEKKNLHKFGKNIKKSNNEVPEVIELLTDDSDEDDIQIQKQVPPPPKAARARAPPPKKLPLLSLKGPRGIRRERHQRNFPDDEVIDLLTDDSDEDVIQVQKQVPPPEAARVRAPPEDISNQDVHYNDEQLPPEAARALAPRPRPRRRLAIKVRRDREPPLPEGQVPANEHHIEQLPTNRISENDTLPEHARTCGICHQKITTGDLRTTLPCFHFFHTNCCTRWLRIDGSCPLCKERIEDNL